MKAIITGTAIFASTLAVIAFFPTSKAGTPITPQNLILEPEEQITGMLDNAAVDVVFVLDTTSSMGGFIDTAKEKIWSIATTMTAAQQTPDIRIGLVAFRDRGDAYVTHKIDLSHDIDSIYAALMDFQAVGGGDGPESVNQALEEAVNSLSWETDKNRYQVIFLVGDAPPHMDYNQDTAYMQSISDATRKGIVVNTIQCGRSSETAKYWQHMAQLGEGRYFQVEQAGGSLAVVTPYDQQLARLSAELDKTRVFYGDQETRQKMRTKITATKKLNESASISSLARRGVFNASDSGKKNLWGNSELVEDVTNGRVSIDELSKDQLPEQLQNLNSNDQKEVIQQLALKREKLQTKIKQLSKSRTNYIETEVDTVTDDRESLDFKLYQAVQEQGKKVGLTYDKGPNY